MSAGHRVQKTLTRIECCKNLLSIKTRSKHCEDQQQVHSSHVEMKYALVLESNRFDLIV